MRHGAIGGGPSRGSVEPRTTSAPDTRAEDEDDEHADEDLEELEEESDEESDEEEDLPSACEQAASGDCEACMACAVVDPCRTALMACKGNAACVTLVDCYDVCEQETDDVRSCHASCEDVQPGGSADAQGILACLDDACGRVCG